MTQIIKTIGAILVTVYGVIMFSGCSERGWEPDPTLPSLQYGMLSDGEYVISPTITLAHNENTKSLTLVVGEHLDDSKVLHYPYPLYKNQNPDVNWENVYYNSTFLGLWIKEENNEKRRAKIKRTSDDSWEGEGFFIRRIRKEELFTVELTFPENTSKEETTYTLEWGLRDQDIKVAFPSTFRFIRAGMPEFKAKYKGKEYVSEFHENSEGEIVY